MQTNLRLSLISLSVSLLVAGCGGGGGSSDASTSASGSRTGTGGTTTADGLPSSVPANASMKMSCVDGADYQCSGSTIIRTDNGVALTSSGVQVYGKSTSDLAARIANTATASGFAPASGGVAEMRIGKTAAGAVSNVALLLSNLGISWDGKNESPQIIETFSPTAGRVQLASNGAITPVPLPDSSDLSFFDFATKGSAATQAHYANNRYFPRSAPSRCGTDVAGACPTAETGGITYAAGNWRTGGDTPDVINAARLHEDGDIHAGNGLPAANGSVTLLPGASGVGVPFPGSKGYRGFDNFGFQYANLTRWISQDTVQIDEWSNTANEHNQNRRGVIAFGDVSDNASGVPASGAASYSGIVHGWYSRNAVEEPASFRGTATVKADFATRKVTVEVQNVTTDDAAATPITAAAFTATATMGAAGSNLANYLTGAVDNGKLKGGIGGRYFGPSITGGAGGNGPAEAGATFSLSATATGEALIGGFVARKQ